MVPTGYMASSGSNTGGGANTLCMPKIPEYLEFTATNDASSSELRRAEYETGASTIPSVFAALNNYEGEQDVHSSPSCILWDDDFM